jgi:DNA-binding NarL/FixJ family response regulator
MESPLSVVVADQSATRADLLNFLADVDGITVVAEAATGHDAVYRTLLHQPHVLVVEPRIPGFDETTMIRHIIRSAPRVAVLVRTATEDDASVCRAIRAGALGYIRKAAAPDAVVRAIRCVAAGDAILGPTVAARLAELLTGKRELPLLTAREHEVLDLAATGLPPSAIARRLDLSTKTVRNHVSAIVGKLDVAGRAEAIALARQAGLGRPVRRAATA